MQARKSMEWSSCASRDMIAARARYDSSAYQAAKAHGLKGARYRVIIANGVT